MALELFDALVADTGTVIVEAEVTATELDALVIEDAVDDVDADEWALLEPLEELPEDDATITYSVEVIVAALVVVGQFTESTIALRKVVVVELVVVSVVEFKPFTCCCSSNDSSVFVDLSAVVLLLADVLVVVVHFITGRGLLVTLLELLLLPLLLLLL